MARHDIFVKEQAKKEIIEAYLTGYKEALKMKVNTTTISDAPLMEKEQLEQAKEIIKKLLNHILMPEGFENGEIIKQAEQFLKE